MDLRLDLDYGRLLDETVSWLTENTPAPSTAATNPALPSTRPPPSLLAAQPNPHPTPPSHSNRPGEAPRMARPADARQLIFKFGVEFLEAGSPPHEHAVRRVENVLHHHAGEIQIGAAVRPPGTEGVTIWELRRIAGPASVHPDDFLWFVDLAPHLGPAPRTGGPWTGIKISGRLCMGNRVFGDFEQHCRLVVDSLRGRTTGRTGNVPPLRTHIPRNATTSFWVGLNMGSDVWEPTVFRRLYIFMYLVEPIVCSMFVPSWRSLQDDAPFVSLRDHVSTLAIPQAPIDATLDRFLGTAAAGRDLQVINWMWTCEFGRLQELVRSTSAPRLVLRSHLVEPGAGSSPSPRQKNMVEFRYLPGTLDMALLRGYAETCLAVVYFSKTSDDFQYAALLDDICECLEETGGMADARRLLLQGLGFGTDVADWWEVVMQRLNGRHRD
ncbi:hypothetical protein PpBr36_02705 [Pyricularia pennisetigena]|uniref:hypothetical protein n=1 Tax=Pyricularia pennisetigena TaxID=1578925 RepID=UPI001152515C|nr:hypothetical protein PpBr36_02705 [Pyricularia pennisetigena]TLS31460.1 hypothetical protein PpBr36_02705 [Pyricularia pennisetigena]